MKKTANFHKVPVKDIEGKIVEEDIHAVLGNLMYMRGQSIEECETGSAIYHAEGDVELDEKQVAAVRRFAEGYPYVLRTAIDEMLA